MPKYHVTARVNSVYELDIEAGNEDEALRKAADMIEDRPGPDAVDYDLDNWDVEPADPSVRPTEGFV